MDTATIQNVLSTNLNLLTGAAFKVIAAIVLWFIGRKLIDISTGITSHTLKNQRIDPTLIGYLVSSLTVLLNIILIVAILGYFGVETTSFAALLAAVGVAIGAAWSGLLANFAAGAFLIVLRPFQVGDFISAGGITGTVVEIGLFVTTIDTPDNVRTFVGNNKLFSDNIQNFSTNAYRRVDIHAQLDHSVNHGEAIRVLRERISNIPNVISNPTPQLEILEFTALGPVLAVRPFCNNTHYWQVYFDTNRVIRESFSESGFPVPQQHFQIRQS
ncbi:mechanosensitive ion channel family protein [Pseudanabaena sp. 'Roaring Creek']|uniref:mechanosensitive ion channel family protein n=1 Tax=Pseudanabaena sp. 'Roaring Creek' TaxID=1681830 RepID=UPI0006D81FDE|nr:mechanosensitive ion channel family protein [Pseudanabaena sp. 'Roaring Creek']